MGSLELETENETGLLKLGEDITIQDGLLLKKALEDSIQQVNVLKLDVSQLDEGDLTLLQFLISAKKTFDKKGKKLETVGKVPKVLINLINDSGFSHQLNWLIKN